MFERKIVGEILLFGIKIARIDRRGHKAHRKKDDQRRDPRDLRASQLRLEERQQMWPKADGIHVKIQVYRKKSMNFFRYTLK